MTKPTVATLTERYVYAVVRSLPERSRADVADELRGLIADEIDARTAEGADPAHAERSSITALGDPARLAASYSQRPLYLIGPQRFLEWWRLLRLLLIVVLPCAGGGILLAKLLQDASISEIILETVAVMVHVVVHLAFWVTLIFAAIDRFAPSTELLDEWTPDELVDVEPDHATQRWTVVSGVAWFVIVTSLVVAQQVIEPIVTAAGDRAPVLDPALWSWWLPYFIVVAFVELVVTVVAYRRGRWGIGEAALNIVFAIALAVPLVVLIARDQLVSPELMSLIVEATDASIPGILGAVLIVATIVATLWDSIDGVMRAARNARLRR